MAGQFMNKEQLESEAARLGVDLEGLTWPQKQKAVMAARSKEAEANLNIPFLPDDSEVMTDLTQALEDDPEEMGTPVQPGTPVYIRGKYDPMEDLRGKTVMICPEMAATDIQLFGYEEVLGDEVVLEEVKYDIGDARNIPASKDMASSTYRVTGNTGKKVVAQSALPKEGAGITFTFDKDIVPVVHWQGRVGYLWTHQRLSNIKQLLIDSGYYNKYKDRFVDEPFIWHAAGKLLACDINLVHSIFREIEDAEQARFIQAKQNKAFVESQLG